MSDYNINDTEELEVEEVMTSPHYEGGKKKKGNRPSFNNPSNITIGGMLTGKAILEAVEKGDITISDFDKSRINPNSYNLRLHPDLKVYTEAVLDSRKANKFKTLTIPNKGLVLKPGELYIGRSVESTSTKKFIPGIDGRSSIGRLGINVHVTAGFGDIGFSGTWTLEIVATKPVIVYPYDEIAQIYFFSPYGDTSIQYDGRYQNEIDPTVSKIEESKKVYLND